jgi:site-specific DNA-methyltransferase (adenine-specific)
VAQHATRDVYAFVPDLSYDRVWSDTDLYSRYGLTPDEISFVEFVARAVPAEDTRETDEGDDE